jgi:hypothetical protein
MNIEKVNYPFHLYGSFRRENGEMVMMLRDDNGITKGFFPIESAANPSCPVGDRVVACLNACKGIPDPETTIPKMVAAVKELFKHTALIHKYWGDNSNQKESDAAIKALEDCLAACTETNHSEVT